MRLLVLVAAAGCGRIGFADRASDANDAPHDGSSSIQLVAHTMINVHANGLTTGAINTTGASLIVIAECTWDSGTPVTPTDSQGNTWQAGLSPYGAVDAPATIKMFYAYGPNTGASHTFTDAAADYLSIGVLAFSGTIETPAVLDTASGATAPVPFHPGSVSPSQSEELVVTFACSGESIATAITIDSSFTLVDSVTNGMASAPEDMGSAYLVASSATDPGWTFTGDVKVTGTIGSFVHP